MRREAKLTAFAVVAVALSAALSGSAAKGKTVAAAGFYAAETSGKRAEVTMTFDGAEVSYVDEILPLPDHTAADEYDERRINAPLAEKLACVRENIGRGIDVRSAILYSFPLLENTVGEVKARVNRPPENADVRLIKGSSEFAITPDRSGRETDEERLYVEIYSAFCEGRERVRVPTNEIKPTFTEAEARACTRLRSRFSTSLASSTEIRKRNVRLALERIDGIRLARGEEFSFNAAVGERSEENGFGEAKVIVGGEYVLGVGGGVCQASTTLYDAALLAGIESVSAAPHSLPPSYVPPSFDAMVNSGSSDLKITNDTDGFIFIRAFERGDEAIVEIYGTESEYEIVRKSEIVSVGEIPPDREIIDVNGEYGTAGLKSGEKKRVGYGSAAVTSRGYLVYYKNGEKVKEKLIRQDSYRARAGTVAVRP